MYIELHSHSCFSLLDGASRPEALVARAAELGMPALALTDNDALYGAVIFWRAANEAGIKPIFGAEVTVEPLQPLSRPLPAAERGAGEGRFPLLAENNIGFANLTQLITKARLRSAKGQALVTWDDLAAHRAGLIALSGGRQSVIAQHLLAGRFETAQETARRISEIFGPEQFLYRAAAPGPARRRAVGAGFAGLGRTRELAGGRH